jgi:inosine-uridine nucleoside N-ribohydrolase
MPVTLVGLDVCDRVFITSDDDRWARGGSPAERLARRLTDGWFARHDAGARYTPCDAMAVLAVTNPELMSFRQASVRVETEDAGRRGQTVARYGTGNVMVATRIRAAAALETIATMLAPVD